MAHKYTAFDHTEGSANNLVVGLVPKNSRVLEFGCATGYMSEILVSRLGCTVTGIEVSPDAAELARAHCERVIVGDAEQLDYDKVLKDEQFDAILFADVLEHLRDPQRVLQSMHPFLAESGSLVASIPNVAHGSLRLALLAGEFRYRELGLLDETHLRFFTRESIEDLFESSGYFVSTWLRRRLGLQDTELRPSAQPPAGVLEWLSNDPEATTYQFVLRALPATTANKLADLRRQLAVLKPLRRENERLRGDSETLRDTLSEQNERIASLAERESELTRQLAELQRELARRDERLQRQDDVIREHVAEIRSRDREISSRDEELEWRRSAQEALEKRVDGADQELEMLQSTRAWRLAQRYWRLKNTLRR